MVARGTVFGFASLVKGGVYFDMSCGTAQDKPPGM